MKLDQKGFTLLDTMIIAGLLLFLISAFMAYQFQRARETKARDTRTIYKQVQSNLKSGAAQSQTIGRSEELGFDNLH